MDVTIMQQAICVVALNRAWLAWLLIAVTSIASQPTLADDAVTRWACGYNGDMLINCMLRAAPAASARGQAETTALASRSGTAPADARAGRLPAVVQIIRGSPGALAGKQVRIPLHTELTDVAFAQQLAQAVMCGSRAACSVEFEPTMFEPAQLSPVDLADRTDTALEE